MATLATNYRLTYEDGQLINRVEVSQEVITTPVPGDRARRPEQDDFRYSAIVRHAGLSVKQQCLCDARYCPATNAP